jgi:hypothetical protein
MNPGSSEKQHLFDDPRNVRRVLRGLFAVCAALVLLDVVSFLLHMFAGFGSLRHEEGPLDWLPGYYPVYGFVACALLVLIAKELRKILMRDEDYDDR